MKLWASVWTCTPYQSLVAHFTWCIWESLSWLLNAHNRRRSVDWVCSLVLTVDSAVCWTLPLPHHIQPLGHRAARKHVKRSPGHRDSGTKWCWRKGQSLSVCFLQRSFATALYSRQDWSMLVLVPWNGHASEFILDAHHIYKGCTRCAKSILS